MSRRLRILLIDDSRGTLASGFLRLLSPHDVEVASDTLDAIHRIDCAAYPHDLIFCDLVRGKGELSGPLLWAYLKIGRPFSARRMVFVATKPIDAPTEELLSGVTVPCIYMPTDSETLDELFARFTTDYSPPLLRLSSDSRSVGKAS